MEVWRKVEKSVLLALIALAASTASVAMAKVAASSLSQRERLGEGVGGVTPILVYIAAIIPVSVSTLAAATALRVVASAGLAAATEKPELRGTVVIIAGLAEGIAIYGLLISILIFTKI